MKTATTTILTIAIALTISATFMVAAGSQAVQAANDKFTTSCSGPGNSGNDGECEGGSQNSGPHDETTANPAGNVPPGQQEPERDDP